MYGLTIKIIAGLGKVWKIYRILRELGEFLLYRDAVIYTGEIIVQFSSRGEINCDLRVREIT